MKRSAVAHDLSCCCRLQPTVFEILAIAVARRTEVRRSTLKRAPRGQEFFGAFMLGLVLVGSSAFAQNPVQWTLSSDVTKAAPGSTIPLKLTATVDEGWHVYALASPAGIPTTIAHC